MRLIRNEIEIFSYELLDEDAARQYIDSRSIFLNFLESKRQLNEVRGGMYWKTKGNQKYLIRTSSNNSQKSLGVHSPRTQEIYENFIYRKSTFEKRFLDSKESLNKAIRLNRALRVGRVPNIVIELLNAFAEAGISNHFTVVGTHAMYAYETQAGIRFNSRVVATKDVDLLWDTRKRFKLALALERSESSLLQVLKSVDSTFEIRTDQAYTAVNSKGFEVDILRREVKESDPHPVKISDHETDFWVVQAKNADDLINAKKFTCIIVGVGGGMSQINTISPEAFIKFKFWLANQTTREALKRSRDFLQAQAVQSLLEKSLLIQ